MSSLPARKVMKQVAEAVPAECRRQIIIVGSLAAAYHFLGHDSRGEITTKDVDGMLSPNVVAVQNARLIAERLFAAGWTLRKDPLWGQAGSASTAENQLPILRLHPPGNNEWFLELAAAPKEGALELKGFQRLSTANGDFTLHSFRFLSLAEEDPFESEFELPYARPEMMALANLLHHPRIAPTTISGGSEKRSNKDLGRVIALAYLAIDKDPDVLDSWHVRWVAALQKRFPREWKTLAARAGQGLRDLLTDEHKLDLDEATRINNLSLLRGWDLGPEQHRATGRRILFEAVRPLEIAAHESVG